MPDKIAKHKIASTMYKRLLTYVLPYWPMMLLGLVATALFSGVDAAAAYAIKPFINLGFIDKNPTFIAWAPLVILIAFLVRGIANFGSSYCIAWVARMVIMLLRREMFAKLLQLPSLYYDQTTSGKIISKILYDVEQVSRLSMDALSTFVQSLCIVVGLIIVMFAVSWQLTLLFAVTLPLIILIVRLTNKRIRRVSQASQQVMGLVTEVVEEAVEGYRVVRIYGGEAFEKKKFTTVTGQNRAFDMKEIVTRGYCVSGVQIVAACGVTSIVALAINPHFSTVLSAGAFASMVASMLALLKPLKNLTQVNGDIQRGLAGAESIFQFLDLPSEKDNGQRELTRCEGAIHVENVSFSYKENDKAVLKNITVDIKPGKTVALVGRSGSGKSSLVSLLCRFYEIESGKISIDGINIQDLKLASLRQQIAIVSQHVILFNGTIAENIAYGQQDVSLDRIKEVAVAAHAMEFINHFPQGLQTIIGENGVLLSGGQRQRIAIARAILKNAPILILDEATSALDSESERYIQAALDEVIKNRTTVVIAHRLSTIEKADQIIVLDAGRIVESGTHQELLAINGHYANLHAIQFSKVQPARNEQFINEAIG